jgi:glycosyltransferase involved in cell wall biosynthesis
MPVNELEYSIVVPVFNSEASLEELFSRLTQVMDQTGKTYEMIFVDDGSLDQSWEVMKKIKEENPGVFTAIRLAKNFGQHSATFCGFNFVKGKSIITLDDDLQCPPEEIPKLIKAMDESDAELVYGIYKAKKHSLARNIGSKTFKNLSGIVYGSKRRFILQAHFQQRHPENSHPSPEFCFYR